MIKISDKVIFTGWQTDMIQALENLPIGTELIVTDVGSKGDYVTCDIYDFTDYYLYQNEYKVIEEKKMSLLFRTGDRVKCVDDSNLYNQVGTRLTKGNVYTVQQYNAQGLILLVGMENQYGDHRFEKYVPPVYKVCIRNGNHPDKTEIALETTSEELAQDLVVNLSIIFSKFEYKTFNVFSKKENEL